MDQINPTMVVVIGFIIVIIIVAFRYKELSATVKGLGARLSVKGKTADKAANPHAPGGGIFSSWGIGKVNYRTQGTSKIEKFKGIGDVTATAEEAPPNAPNAVEPQKPQKRGK